MHGQQNIKKKLPSSYLSARYNSAPKGRISTNIWVFFERKKNLSRKIQASKKSDKNKGYIALRRTYTSWFLAQFFLDWEMFHAKVVEKIKAHILFIYTVYILLTVNPNIFIS